MTLQELTSPELYAQLLEAVEQGGEEGAAWGATLRAEAPISPAAYQGMAQERESLRQQLAQSRLEGALRLSLLRAGAEDVDYLAFKLQEEAPLELDEQGQLRDWSERLAALKRAHPRHFAAPGEGGSFSGYRPLGEGAQLRTAPLSRSELLKKPYQERLALYRRDPEGYMGLFQ